MCAEGKFRKPIGSYTGITKEDREWYNRRAKEKAQETIRIMAEKGILTPNDDPRAVKALEAAVEMLESPAPQREKLAAARLILDFTKAKPASSSIVTVNKAEEWLAAITKEEGDAEGPAGNSEETSR